MFHEKEPLTIGLCTYYVCSKLQNTQISFIFFPAEQAHAAPLCAHGRLEAAAQNGRAAVCCEGRRLRKCFRRPARAGVETHMLNVFHACLCACVCAILKRKFRFAVCFACVVLWGEWTIFHTYTIAFVDFVFFPYLSSVFLFCS